MQGNQTESELKFLTSKWQMDACHIKEHAMLLVHKPHHLHVLVGNTVKNLNRWHF